MAIGTLSSDFILDYFKRLHDITDGCSADMHEPDGLSVEFVEGFGLDNACVQPPTVLGSNAILMNSDAGFWIVRDAGEPTERREWFNLACILAIVRSGPWVG